MPDEVSRKFQKELNSGAISLVLLTLIHENGEPMYGYEIAKRLQQEVGEHQELPMNQAALYPVLRSLESQGLLASQTVPSENGPPRRYYHLTSNGVLALPLWRDAWNRTKSFVDSFLEREHESSTSRTGRQVSKKPRTGVKKAIRSARRRDSQ